MPDDQQIPSAPPTSAQRPQQPRPMLSPPDEPLFLCRRWTSSFAKACTSNTRTTDARRQLEPAVGTSTGPADADTPRVDQRAADERAAVPSSYDGCNQRGAGLPSRPETPTTPLRAP